MPPKRGRPDGDDKDGTYEPPTPNPKRPAPQGKPDSKRKAGTRASYRENTSLAPVTPRTKQSSRNQESEPPQKQRKSNTNTKAQMISEMDSMKKELAEVKVENEELRRKRDASVDRKLASIHREEPYIQDDSTICENIDLLFQMITDWATDWSRKGCAANYLNAARIDVWLNGLNPKNSHDPVLASAACEKWLWSPAGGRYVVEHVVSKQIARAILLRPLHFLLLNKSKVGLLKEVYRQVFKDTTRKDSLDGRLLDSRILRAKYDPKQYEGAIEDSVQADDYESQRSVCYEDLAQRILGPESESSISEFLQPCDEAKCLERDSELLRIFHTAGKLCLQLWVQDSSLEKAPCPRADDDLDAALLKGLCALRSPLVENVPGDHSPKPRIDQWVHPGFVLIRHERVQQTRILIRCPTFITMNDDKCKQNKDKHNRESLGTIDSMLQENVKPTKNGSCINTDSPEQQNSSGIISSATRHSSRSSKNVITAEQKSEVFADPDPTSDRSGEGTAQIASTGAECEHLTRATIPPESQRVEHISRDTPHTLAGQERCLNDGQQCQGYNNEEVNTAECAGSIVSKIDPGRTSIQQGEDTGGETRKGDVEASASKGKSRTEEQAGPRYDSSAQVSATNPDVPCSASRRSSRPSQSRQGSAKASSEARQETIDLTSDDEGEMNEPQRSNANQRDVIIKLL